MATRWIRALPTTAVLALWTLTPARAATVRMAISVDGHAARVVTPGTHIDVTVSMLPEVRHAYCLGLASAIDRFGLPVTLGQFIRDVRGSGRIKAVIPLRLFPAEPVGPFLLFVGTCTPVAPDRPFLAHSLIRIVPSTAGQPRG